MAERSEAERRMNSTAHLEQVRAVRFRDMMTYRSRLRYLLWRAGAGRSRSIVVRFKNGLRIILRPPPSNDLATAMEVFVCEAYRSPRPLDVGSVRRIFDLGANVGFASLYFSTQFADAVIEAYEPHPDFAKQCAANLKLNNLQDRVALQIAAVGNKVGEQYLTDAETHSSLVETEGPNRLRVKVVDWLDTVGEMSIDLLKMDIEGGEYSILFDPRFAKANIKNLVVEWHATAGRPTGDEDIAHRLSELGYRVEPGPVGQLPQMRFGLLWGYRTN